MSAQTLEACLLGVGKVLRLERDAWSMFKRLRQATIEYAPPPSPDFQELCDFYALNRCHMLCCLLSAEISSAPVDLSRIRKQEAAF